MRTDIMVTLTGPDRVGIVEEVTGVLLGLDGNVGTGRMARLGGGFAMLMLVSVPEERLGDADAAFASLRAAGYSVSIVRTGTGTVPPGDVYTIDVRGADHEGIIHEIARGLAARGISIESAESGTVEAPVSGVPLFFMTAVVRVPDEASEAEWIAALDEAARHAGVDFAATAGSPD